MPEMKTGLALGGGSARGLAHIGVLKLLQELDIKISVVAGTSAGSIIGSLFAAGYSADEIAELAKTTSWRDLTHLVVPRISLVGHQRMERKLDELLKGRDFSELQLPFAAVCTDLYTAEAVALRKGKVSRAVTASCSVPGIFPPVEWGDTLLVDGGLVENVPVLTARQMGADRVIGVDLYASVSKVQKIDNIIGTLMRSFEIMQRSQCLAEFQSADICIGPDLAGESLIDLARVDHYIRLGYDAAMACKQQLLQLKG